MKPLILPFVILSAVLIALIPAIHTHAADTHILNGTQWQLISFGEGSPVIPNSSITLMFDEDHQFGGTAGCNSYGGTYEVDGDTINFSEIISTLMACIDDGIMQQEQAFLDALHSATSYELTSTQLVITYGDGLQLIFRSMSTLPNTEWQLVSYGLPEDATEVRLEIPITIEFSNDNQFGGFGGCNQYGGLYDAINENLTFRELFSTRRACVDEALMAQEQLYFAALETATGYRISENQLTIYYSAGEQLLFMQINTLHDSQWQLVSYGDELTMVPESIIMLEFGANNRFAGIGGCNNYSGSYETENDTISFNEVLSTRRACEDATMMEQEQIYFSALESATRFELHGDQLVIEYGDGEQLKFIRFTTSLHVN